MSEDLEEIGAELDRVLRTAAMSTSQLAENLARRSTAHRENAAAAARQEFLNRRDQARALYLPLSYGNAADVASPQQLHTAWAAAAAWAGQDPQAARAAAFLADRLPRDPAVRTSPPTPNTAARTGAPAPVDHTAATVEGAVAVASEHAPDYYTRHHLDRQDDNPEQLIADWAHWQSEGVLPARSVREEWARHVGRLDEAQQAGGGDPAAYDAALQKVWETSGTLSENDAIALAGEHAPAYYTRHDPDSLAVNGDTEQLVADWSHWREHGQLPMASRQEQWAAYVGQGADFAPDQWQDAGERSTALQQVWEQGRDERGLLEMTDHLDQLDAAGMDSGAINTSTLADDIDQFRHERDAAHATYTPLLDTAAFAAASQGQAVTAWEQAAGWAGQDPAANAAATQLDQQFRTRWGTSPMDYLLDRVGDQVANRVEAARAQDVRGIANQDLVEAGNLDQEHDNNVEAAGEALTPQQAREKYIVAARATISADQLRADAEERTAADPGTTDGNPAATKEAAPPEARYDRAAEADLDAPDITPAARQARIESAPAFTQSLREGLNNHHRGAAKKSPVASSGNGRSRSAEHDLGR